MTTVTLGGERLGSGNRQKVHLHNYERSTHDLSFIWRSTMASGTLVPFLCIPGLPGDTMDINLNCEVLTHPTIGPLFGSYKVQLDVFVIPWRLYQAQLHMNMLNIGRDMSAVKLPQLSVWAQPPNPAQPIDNQQINPSCILSYLGIRGLGIDITDPSSSVRRYFNALPLLSYWSIYKQYYANKQEEIGAVIHKRLDPDPIAITSCQFKECDPEIALDVIGPAPGTFASTQMRDSTYCVIVGTGIDADFDPQQLRVWIKRPDGSEVYTSGYGLFQEWQVYTDTQTIVGSVPANYDMKQNVYGFGFIESIQEVDPNDYDREPQIITFDLNDIDTMRLKILQWADHTQPFVISETTLQRPYDLPFREYIQPSGKVTYTKQFAQEGLGLKTYNSDLLNNWISTEWIDGAGGISEITAIDTSSGSFTIDSLNISNKIYNMLNRIAVTGGTYDDWLDAVFTHERTRSTEEPVYIGGLIKNLVFQEVVSNSAALTRDGQQPLGTLAGRGTMGSKHKGGKIIAKIDEPSYIMGIVSITPNIDYSQGNSFDVNFATMNDPHKPALDQIGFQDLNTDLMAWWDTRTDRTGTIPVNIFKSAGKQPAWTNYMTNINKVYGNFADQAQQMFMVLNRRYTPEYDAVTGWGIADVTTYIDPVKFNYIFADTRRDAQNFWTQIAVSIEARRKMSAKIMPNL